MGELWREWAVLARRGPTATPLSPSHAASVLRTGFSGELLLPGSCWMLCCLLIAGVTGAEVPPAPQGEARLAWCWRGTSASGQPCCSRPARMATPLTRLADTGWSVSRQRVCLLIRSTLDSVDSGIKLLHILMR